MRQWHHILPGWKGNQRGSSHSSGGTGLTPAASGGVCVLCVCVCGGGGGGGGEESGGARHWRARVMHRAGRLHPATPRARVCARACAHSPSHSCAPSTASQNLPHCGLNVAPPWWWMKPRAAVQTGCSGASPSSLRHASVDERAGGGGCSRSVEGVAGARAIAAGARATRQRAREGTTSARQHYKSARERKTRAREHNNPARRSGPAAGPRCHGG